MEPHGVFKEDTKSCTDTDHYQSVRRMCQRGLHLRGIAFALLISAALADAEPSKRRQYADISKARDVNGSFECRCLDAFPAAQAAVPGLLAAKGFSAGYGLEGCKPYDAGIMCVTLPPRWPSVREFAFFLGHKSHVYPPPF